MLYNRTLIFLCVLVTWVEITHGSKATIATYGFPSEEKCVAFFVHVGQDDYSGEICQGIADDQRRRDCIAAYYSSSRCSNEKWKLYARKSRPIEGWEGYWWPTEMVGGGLSGAQMQQPVRPLQQAPQGAQQPAPFGAQQPARPLQQAPFGAQQPARPLQPVPQGGRPGDLANLRDNKY